MLKSLLLSAFFLLLFQPLTLLCQRWQPVPGPLTTPWTEHVSPDNALPEYPRPQMLRTDWLNLNGLWDLVIFDKTKDKAASQGKILVPYPVESSLSGIGKKVEGKHTLVYRRYFTVPQGWAGKRTLLHFGAVDWSTEVFVNNKKVGEHKGGYDAFSFDITDFLTPGGGEQELSVQATDPSNEGGQPIGKQHLDPSGIWYTPSSGIWQTVWIEPVPQGYIERYRIEPDLDKERIIVRVETGGNTDGLKVSARVKDGGMLLGQSSGKAGTPLLIQVRNPHRWTPSDPFLYDLEITLEDAAGKPADKVKGYFGMRKTSIGKDAKGVTRLLLNNEFVFQLGPLDQGFYPDGLYTPPTEAAMEFDLKMLKAMGFNMIRKHVKVEPERWYYLCDRMGFLVWQDMPSDKNETPEDRIQFTTELQAMVDNLFNHPSIVMWVPFNEGWGQHDEEFVVAQLKKWDPTRLVNHASGWTDKGISDVSDIHDYPGPSAPKMEENRASVLGEFGGLGLNVAGHQWATEGWGYQLISTPEALLARYEDLYRNLLPLIDSAGLSAAVYTQVSDVETENNGLVTYDRKVIKMDTALVRLAHGGYLPPQPVRSERIFYKKAAIELATVKPGAEFFYTLDPALPRAQWKKYTAPVSIKKNKTLRCEAVWPDGKRSRQESYSFTKVKAIKSKVPGGKFMPGLTLKIFEGGNEKLPDLSKLTASKTLTVSELDLSQAGREEEYALLFQGYIQVPETGVYSFYCASDDGSRLTVANQIMTEDDGLHGMRQKSKSIVLKKGKHPIRLEFFQNKGGKGLEVWWEGPGFGKKRLGGGEVLFH